MSLNNSLDDTYNCIKKLKTFEPIKSDFSYKDLVKKEDLENFYKKIKQNLKLFDRLFYSKEDDDTNKVYLYTKFIIRQRLKVKKNLTTSYMEIGNLSTRNDTTTTTDQARLNFLYDPDKDRKLKTLVFKTKTGKLINFFVKDTNNNNPKSNIKINEYEIFHAERGSTEESTFTRLIIDKKFNVSSFKVNNLICKGSITATGADSGKKNVDYRKPEEKDQKVDKEVSDIDRRDNISKSYKLKIKYGVVYGA